MLSAMEEFRNLDRDIENNSKRWRKFVEAEVFKAFLFNCDKFFPDSGEGEVPTGMEEEGCSTEALHDEVSCCLKYNIFGIFIFRGLRPDRMTYAMHGFVEVQNLLCILYNHCIFAQ